MNATDHSAVLERHLLLQLGDRLKRLRKAQGLGTVAMAQRAGISRTTLSAVEAGDPGPSIGTYLRVMSILGVAGELDLLAGDTLQPPPPDTAAARSRRAKPAVQVLVTADDTRHQIQDLQSLALHEEAVRRASPLATVLPEGVRQNVLAEVRELRKGVVLGDDANKAES